MGRPVLGLEYRSARAREERRAFGRAVRASRGLDVGKAEALPYRIGVALGVRGWVEEGGRAGRDAHSSQGRDEWGARFWGWSTGARGPGKRGEPSAERCALRAGRMVERRKPCHTRLGWSSGRWRGWRNAVARGAIATHHKGAMNGVPGCGVGVPERAGQGREASLRQSGARFAR